MAVLVVYGSRHGSTAAIAETIGSSLRSAGAEARLGPDGTREPLTVNVVPAEQEPEAHDFDAVIIGSAVYGGRFTRSIRSWIDRNATALANMPVWLFWSGPLGGPEDPPPDEPLDVADVMTLIGPRAAQPFGGMLRRASLGLGERALVAALRVADGDFRDWDAIHHWAQGIADALIHRAHRSDHEAAGT